MIERNDLPALAAFVLVAEASSFTAAAERLGLNPSSVSRSIARLEASLGVRLFRRSSRVVVLTHEGHVLYGRARDAFDRIDEARELLQGMRSSVRGELRVTVPIGIGRKHLLPALPAFLGRFPDLRVEVMTTDRRVDLNYENIDVAVRAGSVSPPSLRATKVRDSRFACVATPDFLSRLPRLDSPSSLSSVSAIQFRLPAGGLRSWRFEAVSETLTVEPHAVLVLDDGPAIVDAVLADVGVAYVPDYLAVKEIRAGRLVRLFEEMSVPAGAIHCAYTERRESTLRVKVFVDFVREVLNDRI